MPQPILFFNYNKIADEVIAAGIPKNDIFYFEGTPLQHVFKNVFNAVQTMLFLSDEIYGIHPARIVYNNSISINAKAGTQNGIRILSINSGLIVRTTNFFIECFNAIPRDKLSFLQTASEKLPDPIPELMRDFSVRLTIDHEFAHLIQRNANSANSMWQEYGDEAGTKRFSLEHHILEYDADLWGTMGVGSAMQTYFEGLPVQSKTSDMLTSLISLALTSLLCKFFLGQQTQQEIYFNEFRHPHPIIRTIYISNRLRQLLSAQPYGAQVNWTNVVGNSIYLASLLLKTKNFHFAENVLVDYVRNYRNIQKYIEGTIAKNIANVKNLTLFRPPASAFEITWDKILAKLKTLEAFPPILDF